MSGQSLTLVVGVPLAAWIGSMIGWRGWNLVLAGLALTASFGLLVTLGRGPGTAGHTLRRRSLGAGLTPAVLALLGTGIAERICYGLAAVYFATFLQEIYGLSLAATAVPLAIFALGNIVGTIVGGQLADRWRDRLLTFAIAMALSAMAALALFMWHPGPAITVALGVVYCLAECARPAVLHGGPRRGAGRGARHRAGLERGHRERRLGRRRRPRRRHDQHGRLRGLWPAGRHARRAGCVGSARLPTPGAPSCFYLRLFYMIYILVLGSPHVRRSIDSRA